jgi:tetratricopeptide (TPR) repeat protein
MVDRAAAIRCMQQAAQSRADTANPQSAQLTYQLYQSAVISDPTFAEGWIAVGDANMGYSRLNGSVSAYRRALELPDGSGVGDLNPERRAMVKIGLGESLRRLGFVREAMKLNLAAVEEFPHLAYGWLNLSQCMLALGDERGAVAAAKRGYDIDPNDVKLRMGLAFARLFNRELAEGLRLFENRFTYKLHAFLQYPYPQWDGKDDAIVYLVADQGIGDTLSFARFVPEACKRSKFVYMAVQPELLRLFAASFGDILNVTPLPCPWPPAEVWTTFMSLPTALGLSDDEIRNAPNIRMPSFQAPSLQWKSEDRKFHIGVAWAGAPANDIDHWRSFRMEYLLELYNVPDIQLYSLQVGERAQDVHNAGCATLIRDVSPYIRDFSDTIGILGHLDLVVCCESALAHICAALNKECWVAYSYHGREFRIGYDGGDRLWSPRHRIFKQDETARWEPVFQQIAKALHYHVELSLGQQDAAE